MIKKILAPSILNADFSCLKEVLQMLEKNEVELLHLDIMDGNFVPNITFGPMMVSTIGKNTVIPLSVHLMIEKPERYIEMFSHSMNKNDTLIVHVEACQHLDRTLELIHQAGLKTGVALNPSTPLELIKHVLDKLDTILIMTVNPGFGGQKFISAMISKITEAREMVRQRRKNINIQLDGGINLENITHMIDAGANILVVGSEIFKDKDPDIMIRRFQKRLL